MSIGGIGGGYGAADVQSARQNWFKKADTDGNGSISKDELSAVLPQNGKGPSVDQIFSKLDTDGDGSISSSEAQAAHGHHHHGGGAAKVADKLFSAADGDGDGSISQDELTTALSKSGSSLNPADFFKSIDSDNDGKISKTELEQGIKSLFEMVKGANDGSDSNSQSYSKNGQTSVTPPDGSFSATA